jgi:hypothetical protein
VFEVQNATIPQTFPLPPMQESKSINIRQGGEIAAASTGKGTVLRKAQHSYNLVRLNGTTKHA